MSSIRSFSLLLIVLAVLVIAVSSSPTTEPKRGAQGDPEKFQALLSTVAEAEIREVLLQFDGRFRDGVFHHDRTAMEAVHSEDPAIATELVRLAMQRRQVSNTTITSTSSPNGANSPTTIAVSPTSTAAAGGSPTQNTQASTTNPELRTSVIAPSTPSGAAAVSSTSGAVIFSESNGKLTTAHSSTAIVSFRPSTTTLLITTTLPDGQASTITSVAVVNAPYTTFSAGAVAAQSATGTPSLVSGGVLSSRSSFNKKMAVCLTGLAAAMLAT